MSLARLRDLVSRLSEEGALSFDEERELGQALKESAEARRFLASYFRFEGALLEQARAGLLQGPLIARKRRESRPLRPVGPALGAWFAGVAAACLLFLYLVSSDRQLRPVEPAPSARASVPSLLQSTESSPQPSARRPEGTAQALPPASEQSPTLPSTAPTVVPVERGGNVAESSPGAASETPSSPRPEGDPGKFKEAVLTEVLIERADGNVAVVGAGGRVPARAGEVVRSGQGLETGSGKSVAILSFPDGTRIEARPDTVLRNIREKSPAGAKTGKSFFLQHGSVWAQVRPQPDEHPLVIHSPRGDARVVGTVFTLRMDPDAKGLLRLDVQEGSVHFTRSSDSRAVDVGAGHSVSSGQSADLVPLRSEEVIQSFQDGRFPAPDYAGTRDTQLVEKNPQGTFGTAKTLLAEAEDPKEKKKASWPLLRWDLSSIPAGSRVHSAWVTLHVVEPSHGQAFHLYEPARSWVETEASWKFASSGNLWRFPGSLGSAERWPAPLGTLTPLQKGEYTAMLSDAGTAVVQSWISAPATNLGLQIAGVAGNAGFHFSSREAPAPEARPRLTLVYAPRK